MKTLITKADGTPTKSKVHALQFLEKKGISKDCLIEENGQFFYEAETTEEVFAKQVKRPKSAEVHSVEHKTVTWETPVFDKNNERTKLHIVGTDIEAIIIAKHPAGQLRNKSAFEISIGDENFVMSVDLISKLFKVWEG